MADEHETESKAWAIDDDHIVFILDLYATRQPAPARAQLR